MCDSCACECFLPDRWKPNRCRECFHAKDTHDLTVAVEDKPKAKLALPSLPCVPPIKARCSFLETALTPLHSSENLKEALRKSRDEQYTPTLPPAPIVPETHTQEPPALERKKTISRLQRLNTRGSISRSGNRKPMAPKKAVPAAQPVARTRRARIVEEILTSEITYVRNLTLLAQDFKKLLEDLLSPEQMAVIFANAETIEQLHREFLAEIREHITVDISNSASEEVMIGEIFCRRVPFMKLYAPFMAHHEEGTVLLDKLCKTRKDVRDALETFSCPPIVGALGLKILRSCPVHRIGLYVLLLKDLIKHTPEDNQDYENLQRAMAAMKEIGLSINEAKRMSEQDHYLKNIDDKLTFANRFALADSISVAREHEWVEKSAIELTSCLLCGSMIFRSYSQCEECGVKCHTGCVSAMPPCRGDVIESMSLIRHDRKMIERADVHHYCIGSNGEMDLSSATQLLLLLVSDALIGLLDNARRPEVYIVLKWFSRLSKQFIEVTKTSDRVLRIVAPRDGQIHFFEFLTPGECVIFEKQINTQRESFAELQERTAEVEEVGIPLASTNVPHVLSDNAVFEVSGTVPVFHNNATISAFMIEIYEPEGSYTVLKRFSAIQDLHASLSDAHPTLRLPECPGKSLFGRPKAALEILRRCRRVQSFLNELIEMGLAQDSVMTDFFSRTSTLAEEEGADEDDTNEDQIELQSPKRERWRPGSIQKTTKIVGWDYEPETERELQLKEDEIVELIRTHASGWALVLNQNGDEGFVPTNYLLDYTEPDV